MQFSQHLSRIAAAALFAALVAPALPATTWAAPLDGDDDYYADPPSRVGRITQLEGDVALLQPSSDQWESADTNGPIFEGDEIYVGDGGRAEIQFGSGRYLRLDERTDVTFAKLDEDAVRVEVVVGTAIVSIGRNVTFEAGGPAAAAKLDAPGVYRIEVGATGDTSVAVVRGAAEVSGPERSVDVDEGEIARFLYDDPSDVDVASYQAYDDFDAWSSRLDAHYSQLYASLDSSLAPIASRDDIYGIAELSTYGTWYADASYGSCWVPTVASGWSPYSNGYWRWYPGYGYTWISYDPWGWAPFHYGRWSYGPYGWAWVPWSQFSYGYAWSPGLVYWGGYSGYPSYVWVPLAPNEPYVVTRRFDRRHDRNWVPEHLRAGRGIGVTIPGSSARLVPDKSKNDRARIGERLRSGDVPTALLPRKPADTIAPARVKPAISDTVRARAIVVKNPRLVDSPSERAPATRRPARRTIVAVDATQPKPGAGSTDRPTRRDPATPRVEPRDRNAERETTRAERPERPAPRVEPRERAVERPEPRDRNADRQTPRVERREAPRVEQREAPRVERREQPAPRVERREAPRVESRPAPRVEQREAPRVESRPAPPPPEVHRRGGKGR